MSSTSEPCTRATVQPLHPCSPCTLLRLVRIPRIGLAELVEVLGADERGLVEHQPTRGSRRPAHRPPPPSPAPRAPTGPSRGTCPRAPPDATCRPGRQRSHMASARPRETRPSADGCCRTHDRRRASRRPAASSRRPGRGPCRMAAATTVRMRCGRSGRRWEMRRWSLPIPRPRGAGRSCSCAAGCPCPAPWARTDPAAPHRRRPAPAWRCRASSIRLCRSAGRRTRPPTATAISAAVTSDRRTPDSPVARLRAHQNLTTNAALT